MTATSARILETLSDQALPMRTLCYRANCSDSAVRDLIDEGVLEVCAREPIKEKRYQNRWHGKGHPIVRVKR